MDKCSCWEQYLKCGKDYKYNETVGFCIIDGEQRECFCEGDKR